MEKVFETSCLKGLVLQTRTFRSATWEGLADASGFVQPQLVERISELARFSIGLIIPGYLYISPEGRGLPWQTGIWSDDHIDGLNKIVNAVHNEGGVIAAQIAHAGGRTHKGLISGEIPIAPSAVKSFPTGETPLEMDISDIKTIIKCFSDAAQRVKKAGFDAIQLHAAHGYLISQFLSPLYNHRHDTYGGSPKNRRKFLLEVYEAVRGKVGIDFPVFVKLNTIDGPKGGIGPQDSLETAKSLFELGIDAIEISGGLAGSNSYRPSWKGISKASNEAYFRRIARLFKQAIDIPIILVGGIRSYEIAEDILNSGDADYVSFSRPLICEPDLVERWKRGNRIKSKCISCNLCLKEGLKGTGIRCVSMSD